MNSKGFRAGEWARIGVLKIREIGQWVNVSTALDPR
jgi:hypothetical protein